jgi:hypothetical protein
MEVIDPREFLPGAVFRERDFREAVGRFDWAKFRDKPVLIQGCESVTLPTWVYLVITAQLSPYAKSISYGELKNPIPVAGRLGAAVS